MDRIFKYFNKVSSDDIDTEEWVLGFNVFLKGAKPGDIKNSEPYVKDLTKS